MAISSHNISQNIFACLLFIDCIQPYICYSQQSKLLYLEIRILGPGRLSSWADGHLSHLADRIYGYRLGLITTASYKWFYIKRRQSQRSLSHPSLPLQRDQPALGKFDWAYLCVYLWIKINITSEECKLTIRSSIVCSRRVVSMLDGHLLQRGKTHENNSVYSYGFSSFCFFSFFG